MINIATNAESIPGVHDEHSVSSVTFQTLVFLLVLTEAAIGATVWTGWLWLAVPLVLVAAHLMHGLLIGFHEASHGLLRKSRRLNEFDGVLIGVFSLLPFSLYRVVHQTHHMHLATEKDDGVVALRPHQRAALGPPPGRFSRTHFRFVLYAVPLLARFPSAGTRSSGVEKCAGESGWS